MLQHFHTKKLCFRIHPKSDRLLQSLFSFIGSTRLFPCLSPPFSLFSAQSSSAFNQLTTQKPCLQGFVCLFVYLLRWHVTKFPQLISDLPPLPSPSASAPPPNAGILRRPHCVWLLFLSSCCLSSLFLVTVGHSMAAMPFAGHRMLFLGMLHEPLLGRSVLVLEIHSTSPFSSDFVCSSLPSQVISNCLVAPITLSRPCLLPPPTGKKLLETFRRQQ